MTKLMGPWLAATLAFLAGTSLAAAHEGHESGPSPVAASAEAPSLSGRTERFEIVARQIADELVVAIDASDTNAPVAGAVVSV